MDGLAIRSTANNQSIISRILKFRCDRVTPLDCGAFDGLADDTHRPVRLRQNRHNHYCHEWTFSMESHVVGTAIFRLRLQDIRPKFLHSQVFALGPHT